MKCELIIPIDVLRGKLRKDGFSDFISVCTEVSSSCSVVRTGRTMSVRLRRLRTRSDSRSLLLR